MIKRYLIICTFRSGSTILASLLEEATRISDLGEYVMNGPDKTVSLMKYTLTPHSSDLLTFEKIRKERIEFLKNTEYWIVRNPVVAGSTNKELIDYCVDREDTEILFLFRRDISKQFLSDVNNAWRGHLLKKPKNKFFNKEEPVLYDSIDIPAGRIKEWAFGTLQKVEAWRNVYELYKTKGKLVCYEDHIEPLNLSHVGIHKDIVDRYNNKQQHLVKTPYNTTNFKHDNFQNYVDFFESYKYLTDI